MKAFEVYYTGEDGRVPPKLHETYKFKDDAQDFVNSKKNYGTLYFINGVEVDDDYFDNLKEMTEVTLYLDDDIKEKLHKIADFSEIGFEALVNNILRKKLEEI